ncbi:hypothetical protein EYF80_039015 [Liparis tanakae]|uniref:Uncharacterized protein n=1 Tax=Liparis tanakae TaxID=230148 RepID=A0A4Z2GD17_9TELE|nr:hypothetical protein EYF80_039015 [Liparis tanakae]
MLVWRTEFTQLSSPLDLEQSVRIEGHLSKYEETSAEETSSLGDVTQSCAPHLGDEAGDRAALSWLSLQESAALTRVHAAPSPANSYRDQRFKTLACDWTADSGRLREQLDTETEDWGRDHTPDPFFLHAPARLSTCRSLAALRLGEQALEQAGLQLIPDLVRGHQERKVQSGAVRLPVAVPRHGAEDKLHPVHPRLGPFGVRVQVRLPGVLAGRAAVRGAGPGPLGGRHVNEAVGGEEGSLLFWVAGRFGDGTRGNRVSAGRRGTVAGVVGGRRYGEVDKTIRYHKGLRVFRIQPGTTVIRYRRGLSRVLHRAVTLRGLRLFFTGGPSVNITPTLIRHFLFPHVRRLRGAVREEALAAVQTRLGLYGFRKLKKDGEEVLSGSDDAPLSGSASVLAGRSWSRSD